MHWYISVTLCCCTFVSATPITCMHPIDMKFVEARPEVQANSESK
jgi:hypothetical protein